MKQLFLLLVGGTAYITIELIWRGRSHWTMFILGGICFIIIGLLNEIYTWNMALISQMVISAIVVTFLELIAGIIINILFGLDVWDYSKMPYNFIGQICLLYFNLWFLLSLPVIVLDDYTRHWFLREEKPRYRVF
jgi:uncharacterized membrane protein